MKNYYTKQILLIFPLLFFYQCCGAEEAVKSDEKISNKSDYIKPIPRGTIELSLNVQEIVEQDDKIIIKAFIDTVHKYGAGVKPIAEETIQSN